MPDLPLTVSPAFDGAQPGFSYIVMALTEGIDPQPERGPIVQFTAPGPGAPLKVFFHGTAIDSDGEDDALRWDAFEDAALAFPTPGITISVLVPGDAGARLSVRLAEAVMRSAILGRILELGRFTLETVETTLTKFCAARRVATPKKRTREGGISP